MGQRLTCTPEEASDWMIIQDNRLVGGYTIRALRKRMTPEERARDDKTLSFEIDDK